MKKNILFIVSIIVSLVFFSCNNFIDGKLSEEKACLKISVNTDSYRTIYPADITESQISKVELKCKLKTESEFSSTWTWNSITEMTASDSVKVSLNNYYDFLLNLYVTKNKKIVLCQSGTIQNKRIDESNTKLLFNTKYINNENDTGSTQITLTWQSDDRVNSIKTGLFTIESNGETAVENFNLEALEIQTENNTCSACYSKSNIPAGVYFIRFELYAQNETLLNTLEDIIYISTVSDTKKTIPLTNINTLYNITYETGSENFVENFSPVLTRNANKTVLLPTDESFTHTNPKYAFLGWYKKSDFSDERITTIDAGTSGDQTVYARWVEITADNILDVISLMKSSRTISVKQDEVLPYTLISSIGSAIKNKNEFYIGLDFSKATIERISAKAFDSCSGLTEISLPSTQTNIAENAFYNCENLTEIIINSNQTTFVNSSFNGCTKLTKLKINCNVPESCLKDNQNFKTIVLGNNVTEIGNNAFKNCINLEKITLSDNLTTIGSYAFKDCARLAEITLPSSLTTLSAGAFAGCSSITKMSLPATLEAIENYVFDGCTGLSELTFPINFTTVGNYAFRGCTSLSKITLPESLQTLGESAFSDCSNLSEITLPTTLTRIGNNAFNGCSSLSEITLPTSLTIIGDYSFEGCKGLTEITLPSSITKIGFGAFRICSELTKATINCNLNGFENNEETTPFAYCSKLKTIIFGDNVERIGDYSFMGCKISSITLPKKLSTIGKFAFASTDLTSIYFKTSLTSIGDGAFIYCRKLCSVSMNTNLSTIGDFAFENCSSLSEITLPESLQTLGKEVFSGCSELKTVTINSNLADYTLTDYKNSNLPFLGCEKLSKVVFGKNVTSISNYVFCGCSTITEIVFSSNTNITNIGEDAFRYCGITSLTLPSELTNIGDEAFSDCSDLTEITFPAKLKVIGAYAFRNCDILKKAVFTAKKRWQLGDTNTVYSVNDISDSEWMAKVLNNNYYQKLIRIDE